MLSVIRPVLIVTTFCLFIVLSRRELGFQCKQLLAQGHSLSMKSNTCPYRISSNVTRNGVRTVLGCRSVTCALSSTLVQPQERFLASSFPFSGRWCCLQGVWGLSVQCLENLQPIHFIKEYYYFNMTILCCGWESLPVKASTYKCFIEKWLHPSQ